MQGGNENENNDDVNDANVYVKKCGFQFVCRLFKCAIAGEIPRLFLLDWSVIND